MNIFHLLAIFMALLLSETAAQAVNAKTMHSMLTPTNLSVIFYTLPDYRIFAGRGLFSANIENEKPHHINNLIDPTYIQSIEVMPGLEHCFFFFDEDCKNQVDSMSWPGRPNLNWTSLTNSSMFYCNFTSDNTNKPANKIQDGRRRGKIVEPLVRSTPFDL
ncbi:hypothetical protein M409DRAFT_15936 [Zasmidium cellare ATCC 36951]|uniref:Uncharacterized protein n=1 Tax=Zasmidium cellare ATCC 36951 TaxID=1080233 RepID=A0A6A6D5G6_ZASCE|nr:uncharacterized protein M409DRAFT_15936 [Zasmidium cellare ATCC 36951]KAF2173658.1 hypothetical protein M409DRAFT_15936 [Zasmidium cellare ATCC 36951]